MELNKNKILQLKYNIKLQPQNYWIIVRFKFKALINQCHMENLKKLVNLRIIQREKAFELFNKTVLKQNPYKLYELKDELNCNKNDSSDI